MYIFFGITNDFFMNRKNSLYYVNRHLCSNLLSKLQTLENKCDRITTDLSEVKKLFVAMPPDVSALIDMIERSAKEMHEQSIIHREYVERCINSEEPRIHLMRRGGNGL